MAYCAQQIYATHRGNALAGRVVADLLEVDGVDGPVEALFAPQAPCGLLKSKDQINCTYTT
jgi:hypothetical protein